jgi:hypothetical protein
MRFSKTVWNFGASIAVLHTTALKRLREILRQKRLSISLSGIILGLGANPQKTKCFFAAKNVGAFKKNIYVCFNI